MIGRANQLAAQAYVVKKDAVTGKPMVDDKGQWVLALDESGKPSRRPREAPPASLRRPPRRDPADLARPRRPARRRRRRCRRRMTPLADSLS
jgi:hypothetical protein